MFSTIIRSVAFIWLLAALSACQSPCRPCISGWTRPAPVFVDPEAFCALERQIDCLNHRFKPYERAMDRCHYPKRVCKRLIKIDNNLQHANAEMLSHEVAPEKMQRQLDHIYRDLQWVEERICPIPPTNYCGRTSVPIQQMERLDESWLSKLSKTILNRNATPKSQAQPESKNRAITPNRNGQAPPPNQNSRNQYLNPWPTR